MSGTALELKISGDLADLNKQISKLSGPLRKAQGELKAIERALKFNPGNAELVAQKQQVLAKRVEELKSKLEVLKEAKKKADEQFKNGEISEDEYRRLNREIEVTENQLRNAAKAQRAFEQEIDRANSKLGQAADKIGAWGDKAVTSGQKISGLGDKMLKVSAGAGAALLGMGKAAVDFEDAFAGVRKTVDASEAEYAKLRQQILEMTKVVPASAEEIAGVAEAAGQLGIRNKNIMTFSRSMIDLGEATNMTSEQAATALARFANITKMPQTEFDRLGSTIVDLGNNFATTESEITEMSLRLAGAGTQVGLTEADITGVATALSSVGIEAQAGGTAFSKVFKQMAVASETGKEELTDFAKVAGMSADEFAGKFKEKPVEAVQAFLEGLATMDEKGSSSIKTLEEMGLTEIRLSDALLRTSNNASLFGNAISKANRAWGENTALTKEAEQRYATAKSQMKMLWNEVKLVAIELGSAMLPALKDVVGGAKKFVKGFQNMDQSTKKAITKLLLFTAAAAPVLKVTGSMVTAVGTLAKGFRAFTKTKAIMSLISWGKAAKTASAATKGMAAATATTAAVQRTADVSFIANAASMTNMSNSAGKAAKATVALGTSTGKTAGGVASLVARVGGLGTALGIAGIALAGAGLAIYAIKKAIDEANASYFSLEDRSKIAADAVKESNRKLDETATEQVNAFQKARIGIETELTKLEMSGKVITQKIATGLQSQTSQMMDGVVETIRGSQANAKQAFAAMFSGTDTEGGGDLFAAVDETASGRIRQAKAIEDKINTIYANAGAERRSLTANEKKAILKLNQDALDLQIQSVTKGESSLFALQSQLQNQQGAMTTSVAEDTAKKITDTSKAATKDLETLRADAHAAAANTFKVGSKEYDNAISKIDEGYNQKKAKIESSTQEQLQIVKKALTEEVKIREDAAKKALDNAWGKENAYTKGLQKEADDARAALKQIENSIDDSAKAQKDAMGKAGKGAGKQHAKAVKSTKSENKAGGAALGVAAIAGAKAGGKGADKTGKSTGKDHKKGVDKTQKDNKSAGKNLGESAKKGAEEGGSGMPSIGQSIAMGLVSGMKSGSVFAAVAAAGLALVNHMKAKMTGKEGTDSHSPSKWAIRTVHDVASGFVVGSVQNAKRMNLAGMALADSYMSGFSASLVGASAAPLLNKLQDKLEKAQKRDEETLEKMRADAVKRQRKKEKKEYKSQRKSLTKQHKNVAKKNNKQLKKDLKALDKEYSKKKGKNKKLSKKEQKAYDKKRAALIKRSKKATQKERKQLKKDIKKLNRDRKEAVAEQKRQDKEAKIEKRKATYETALSQLKDFYEKRDALAKQWGGTSLFKEEDGFFMLNDFEDDIRKLEKLDEALGQLQMRELPEDLLSEIGGMDIDDATRYAEALNYMSDEEYKKYIDTWKRKEALSKDVATGFLKDDIKALEKAMVDAGIKSAKGLAKGMLSQREVVEKATKEMIEASIKAAMEALDAHSPSRKFEKLADFAADGYTGELKSRTREVRAAMKTMLSVETMKEQMSIANGMLSQSRKAEAMEQGTAIVNAMASTGTDEIEQHIHVHIGAKEAAEALYYPLNEIKKRKGE